MTQEQMDIALHHLHRPPLTYLASPYSHVDPAICEQRFREAAFATAWLMNTKKWNVFSPIVHSHPLHTIAGMSGKWEFWKQIDTEFLQVSKRLVVLAIPGWHESIGVQAEIEIAGHLTLPRLIMCQLGPDNYSLHEYAPDKQS